ncbi:MAG: glycoside hydrolase family 127 protein [Bacteroidales bacterium]
MKNLLIPVFVTMLLAACNTATAQRNDHYITNRSPLVAQPYTSLPLGAIKPHGFLNKMLELQRDGLTGYLDSIYEVVCGPNNGWLGGTGDGWERGPYWLDGLVPLAYILDDEKLKAKAQEWIEWSIENQREDGYFGPVPLAEGYEKIEGTQQGNREDWWPKMVMLKVLQQYYTATGDERVIDLMTDYFRYQLDNLDEYPLGHWTYWANRRGGDNMAVVYWLYNITGEEFLLDLSEKLFEQTYNWTEVYSGNDIRSLSPLPHLHCVNVAQGLKQPVIYYQQHPEKKYLDAVKLGLNSLKEVHGWVNGMYGGDERLHGNEPTQGSELCSAVEMMYSFENILPITGDIYYADYLEKVAYNVLPTQHDDDFTRKQYFQQANQVLISDQKRNFFNDEYSRIVYGVLTGYPCCTANMHQGWPKFIQNLWYATADNGLAALVYGPSEVTAKVAGGKEVKMIQTTDYPFREKITISYETDDDISFPLHIRIPEWCNDPTVKVAGEKISTVTENGIIIINRKWSEGDKVEMTFPMEIKVSEWAQNSRGIERGPLVYGLKIQEEWREVKTDEWENTFFEVSPASPWNYALLQKGRQLENFEVIESETVPEMPWNLRNAPVSLKTTGSRLPYWQLENHSAGTVPVRNLSNELEHLEREAIELIPYGCTTLRISQFPVISLQEF